MLRLVTDRLYAIQMRPHELAILGSNVAMGLRYGPVPDDADAPQPQTQHWKLLVLTITAQVPGKPGGPLRSIELVKCGWEMELASDAAMLSSDLVEGAEEVPRLLARIADTVNELARRAGLEAPLGTEVLDDLLRSYRTAAQTPKA